MRTASFVLLFLAACLSISASAADRLTLADCIRLALRNQPQVRIARSAAEAGEAREEQAASPLYPQIDATTGYSESKSLGGAFGDSTTKSRTTSLSVSQVLYDFGKSGNALAAARWDVRSSQDDEERVAQETVLNVKEAYYALLQAKRLADVAHETVDQTEDHLRQAQAFFRAGSKPRFDVTRAEVDVNDARLKLVNAENAVRVRTIGLNTTMGIDPGKATEIADVPAPSGNDAMPSREQAQNEALRNRPDLRKAESDVEAARARLRAAEAEYLPTLSANGSYNWANGTAEMGPFKGNVQNSWDAGVSLTLPLFQGGLTRGRTAEARANLIAAEARRDGVKQSILLEVNQAYADLDGAKARLAVMSTSMQKARESLALAQGRYAAGVGTSLEVTDARLAEVNAETDSIQAVYDYFLAVARLQKATGGGLQ